VYRWLRALAMFDVTRFPAFVGHRTSFQVFCRYVNYKQHTMDIPFERTPGHDADALVLAHHKLLELRLTGQQVVLLLQNRFNSIR